MKKASTFLCRGLVVTGLFWVGPVAGAAVLATYNFSGTATGNVFDSTSLTTQLDASGLDVNVSASRIVQGADATIAYYTSSTGAPAGAPYLSVFPGNSTVNAGGAAGTALTTAAAAVAADSYFTFTLTANSGYLLNLSSLTFDTARGGSGTRGFALQTSATGFSTDSSTNINLAGVVSAGTSTSVTTTRPTYTPIVLDLSGASYQGLSSLTLRIFSFSGAVSSSVDYDNIVFNGTAAAAVPEPAVWSSLILGFSLLLVGNRFRRPRY
jgi:hypothetical protein